MCRNKEMLLINPRKAQNNCDGLKIIIKYFTGSHHNNKVLKKNLE